MSEITVVGGVYHERCIWPEWDQIFGSGGRAAAALSSHVKRVTLCSYAREDVVAAFAPCASVYGFEFRPVTVGSGISFEYFHSMSSPVIRPPIGRVPDNGAIDVKADIVLRFGMLEGTAKVTADRCVYDPQSAFGPEPFRANGSTANHLAIVGNRSEVLAMAGVDDPAEAARALLAQGAEVVVVKSGPAGAIVVTKEGESVVPAYRTDMVWTVGTGDVFAAIFAARWGVHRESPEYAAELASLAVANYVETMGLPSPLPEQLKASESMPAVTKQGKVYLAGPFFTLGQRWLVDEACRGLRELGLDVFSPIHDIGPGPAEVVGPADIEALLTCDRVFAILDGTDSGTVFEVGYARSKNIPVYALAQSVSDEELKMIVGTECRVFSDFVTAMHHTAWRT